MTQKHDVVSAYVYSVRTQFNLRFGFLAGNIKHLVVFGKMRCRLQNKRGFSDSGVAAHKHERAYAESAAEYSVKFRAACLYSVFIFRNNL